jgi:glycosyltransferase involved in cell wall biosynthesis
MTWPDSSPLVSIVVPTFDERGLLRTCLRSISVQTEPDFECIVVDDAPHSNSGSEIIDEFSGDPRFYSVRNSANLGLAASRNVGLEKARAPFITFLDADDFLLPDALNSRLAAIRDADDNGSLGGAFCNWIFVTETQTVPERVPKQTSRRNITWLDCVDDNVFIASAPLISTAAARKVGGFDAGLATAEDYDFWARYLRHGYALRPTSYVGVGYRQKRSSMFRTTTEIHVSTQISIYEWNYAPLNQDAVVDGTPYVFVEPPGVYRLALNRLRRAVVGVVTALYSKDERGVGALLELLESNAEPWMWWAANWRTLIRRTAERLEAYDETGQAERTQILTSRAKALVLPIVRGGPSVNAIWPTQSEGAAPRS